MVSAGGAARPTARGQRIRKFQDEQEEYAARLGIEAWREKRESHRSPWVRSLEVWWPNDRGDRVALDFRASDSASRGLHREPERWLRRHGKIPRTGPSERASYGAAG